MADADVIVIGSGPAGAHAALALIEAGKSVLMLDGGNDAPAIIKNTNVIDNFEDVRENDPEQYKWFLGEDLSGIPIGGLQGGLGGGQLSGNRAYAARGTNEMQPIATEAQVVQSLAIGGLGAVWGATCAFLSEEELSSMGLDAKATNASYDEIVSRIGVSGVGRSGLQDAIKPDHHARALLAQAAKKSNALRAMNIGVTQPCSAVLTATLGERTPTEYQDMDYWADAGKSVYRPQYTIAELTKHPAFTYKACVVTRAMEEGDGVIVSAKKDEEIVRFSSKAIILAAGAINTPRILLQSRDAYDVTLPIVLKPHAFIPCLHPRMLGKAGDKERVSLCQLLVAETEIRGATAQLYSYRSMMLFRLLSSLRLPIHSALAGLTVLTPCLLIADVRLPGLPDRTNMKLIKNTGGPSILHIDSPAKRIWTADEWASIATIRRALRILGLVTMPTMQLSEGSTSHYAGTVPMTRNENQAPFTVDERGKVRGTKRTYVADASVFSWLPSKPHTLTIMANARGIGKKLAESMS